MDEKYRVLGPDTTLKEIFIIAAKELIENDSNAFEFDLHGEGPDGSIILHFEAAIHKVGYA